MAAANRQVVADGGVEMSLPRSDHQHGESMDENDECEECLAEFPCWECVLTGARELPE